MNVKKSKLHEVMGVLVTAGRSDLAKVLVMSAPLEGNDKIVYKTLFKWVDGSTRCREDNYDFAKGDISKQKYIKYIRNGINDLDKEEKNELKVTLVLIEKMNEKKLREIAKKVNNKAVSNMGF